jgi:nucleolar pre-ribosomal-associated protein 1
MLSPPIRLLCMYVHRTLHRLVSGLNLFVTVSTVSTLGLTAPIILQLSLLPGTATTHLPSLVTKAVDHLKRFEKSTDINVLSRKGSRQGSILVSLHAAHGLHDQPMLDDPLQLWGEWVEALWRATMTFENKHPAWDALTCRLLLWRAIVGEESIVGEWARKEVVRNLCGQVQ